MTAMTAATLDALSGGRFRLGLGVSGPQVSEGWHGVRFDKPLARTREYVEIVRKALAPRRPSSYDGEHYRLPLPGGPGKALRLTVHPVRARDPALPRRGRAEEPGPDRARSPTAGWPSSSPPSTPRSPSTRSAPRGRRPAAAPGGPDGGVRRQRERPGVGGGRRGVGRRPVALRTPPSTSAAWAAGSRTSTTRSPRRMGFDEAAQRVQDLYLDRAPPGGRGGGAGRVHRRAPA